MRTLLVGLIRLYQWGISPLLGPNCRFDPSCSEATRLAILAEGPWRGIRRGLRQIVRCHPWGG